MYKVGSASSYDASRGLENVLNNPLSLPKSTGLSVCNCRSCSVCLDILTANRLVLLKYFMRVWKMTSVIIQKLWMKSWQFHS